MAIQGYRGVQPWTQKANYNTYKSPYGPSYRTVPHFHGINARSAMQLGFTAGSFGAVAGVFALYFFSDVPRVRHDILSKVPFIGSFYVREIPPEDNPF